MELVVLVVRVHWWFLWGSHGNTKTSIDCRAGTDHCRYPELSIPGWDFSPRLKLHNQDELVSCNSVSVLGRRSPRLVLSLMQVVTLFKYRRILVLVSLPMAGGGDEF